MCPGVMTPQGVVDLLPSQANSVLPQPNPVVGDVGSDSCPEAFTNEHQKLEKI